MIGMLPRLFVVFLPVLLLASPAAVFAHRLDEYLQAMIVSFEADRVQFLINLTPGVAVANQVLERIDSNHDGVISTNEAAHYMRELNRDLDVRLDGRKLALQLTRAFWPQEDELRTGFEFIQVEQSVKLKSIAAGPHRLTIQNRHLPSLSVYLINAAMPKSAQIEITRQNRNENQSIAEIDFFFHASQSP
jgi:hypothetical protein